MSDLTFDVQLSWEGTGREGAGEIRGEGLTVDYSGPGSMGGRGVGTSPEQLLVSAVSSCYAATLFGVLRRAGLTVDSLTVSARGTVTGFPGQARFAGIVVSPTVRGGAVERQEEYEAAAELAHRRCFIGQSLAPEVSCEVGCVTVQAEVALGSVAELAEPASRPGADEPPLAWPSAAA